MVSEVEETQPVEEEPNSEEPEENINEDLPDVADQEPPIEPDDAIELTLTEEEKFAAAQASLNDASELLASDPVSSLSDTKALLLDADFQNNDELLTQGLSIVESAVNLDLSEFVWLEYTHRQAICSDAVDILTFVPPYE